MSARTKVVLPAPRSPESVTVSPGLSAPAMSIISLRVASSSGSTTEKLERPVVSSMDIPAPLAEQCGGRPDRGSRRRSLARLSEREYAGDGGAASDRRVERHGAAMQLHKGAHQRQAKAGAAMSRAEGVRFEPIEYLVLHIGRDAGAVVGNRKYHSILEPLGRERNGPARGGKAYCVGQQIEQGLADPPLIRHEAANVRGGPDLEHDAVLPQPVLHAFGGPFHGGADVDRAEVELHGAGIDGGEVEDVVDEREQRVGGDLDIAEIFVLLFGQRPGYWICKKVREADDVGERRAQLVGHVMHEVDLELVGFLQRLVALAQRALDIH